MTAAPKLQDHLCLSVFIIANKNALLTPCLFRHSESSTCYYFPHQNEKALRIFRVRSLSPDT